MKLILRPISSIKFWAFHRKITIAVYPVIFLNNRVKYWGV